MKFRRRKRKANNWLELIQNCPNRSQQVDTVKCSSCGNRGKEVAVYDCLHFDKRVTIDPNGRGIDYCKKCELIE